jgi:hypothetical protein
MTSVPHPCVECAFYLHPSWWKRFREGMFAERCLHPAHRDEVDGSPKPCVTMRLMDCSGKEGPYSPDKFRPIPVYVAETPSAT